MLKEIKILLYFFVIVLFFFLTIKFYLSDVFEKDVYRSYNNHENIVNEYSEKLELIKSDTDNIIEYNNNTNNSKKKYQFWKLIEND
tara:strand:+ start:1501 stop:1758 length:258 start_codon:yes stop_codon:yes gene_type:complete